MGIQYTYDKDKAEIFSRRLGKGENFGIVLIKALEDGAIFALEIQLYINKRYVEIPKEHKYIQELLWQLLRRNWYVNFGTWEYDPSDGELRSTIKISLEDALMTQKQFEGIWGMAQKAAGKLAEIKHIINTGELPEEEMTEMSRMIDELFGDHDYEASRQRYERAVFDGEIFDIIEEELEAEFAVEKDDI
jgi:hypothetical protein